MMYRVVGREFIGGGRLGRFLVEISRSWIEGVRRIYLISDATSFYPGYAWLVKKGDRGYYYLKLYPGTYGYGFVVENRFEDPYDPENPEKLCRNSFFHPDEVFCLSKLVVEKPANPLEDIYHVENDPSYLHRYLDWIVIRLRAPKAVEEAFLEIDGTRIKPVAIHDIGEYNVFEYHVEPRSVLRYRFILEYMGEELIYGDNGFGSNSKPIIVDINNVPGVAEPTWFMGTVYYQIFVDSFDNGDPYNDPPHRIKSIAPREHGYYGGDLRGIINHVDHLRNLGVETIYLTPIFSSTSYHRYDVINYKEIDKYLGSFEDFKELVEKLHSIGLKIVLDITLNHTSPCNEIFIKALQEGVGSKYWSFFAFTHDPGRSFIENFIKYLTPDCRVREIYSKEKWARETRPFYEGFFTSWTMVKFNHENPLVLDYFLDITRYWIDRGVDGFRVDVAMAIDRYFLQQYYLMVKRIKSDFNLLGEVSESPSNYVCCLDSVMNYYLRRLLFDKIVYNRVDLRVFVNMVNEMYVGIPMYMAVSLYNMLGSHDTPRIKSIVGDKMVLKQLYALLFTLPGSPAIYYGDEIGLEGGRDPDNRRPMIWDTGLWDRDIYEHVWRLINIYRSSRALRYGFIQANALDNDILFIKRWLGSETIYVVFNLGHECREAEPPIPCGRYFELYNGETIDVCGKLYVEPRGFLILKPLES